MVDFKQICSTFLIYPVLFNDSRGNLKELISSTVLSGWDVSFPSSIISSDSFH